MFQVCLVTGNLGRRAATVAKVAVATGPIFRGDNRTVCYDDDEKEEEGDGDEDIEEATAAAVVVVKI